MQINIISPLVLLPVNKSGKFALPFLRVFFNQVNMLVTRVCYCNKIKFSYNQFSFYASDLKIFCLHKFIVSHIMFTYF